MILRTLEVIASDFERSTGWAIKPEGACKGDICVPLPDSGPALDVRVLANRLGMPLVLDEAFGVWALGPESGGRSLSSAEAPEFSLPDFNGQEFRLRSLRGKKVLLLAWASW